MNEKAYRERVQKDQEERIKAHKIAKLDHISCMLSRHNMKRAFYKWIEGAVRINNMDAALENQKNSTELNYVVASVSLFTSIVLKLRPKSVRKW